MKRRISVFLLAIILVMGFASCSNDKGETVGRTTTDATDTSGSTMEYVHTARCEEWGSGGYYHWYISNVLSDGTVETIDDMGSTNLEPLGITPDGKYVVYIAYNKSGTQEVYAKAPGQSKKLLIKGVIDGNYNLDLGYMVVKTEEGIIYVDGFDSPTTVNLGTIESDIKRIVLGESDKCVAILTKDGKLYFSDLSSNKMVKLSDGVARLSNRITKNAVYYSERQWTFDGFCCYNGADTTTGISMANAYRFDDTTADVFVLRDEETKQYTLLSADGTKKKTNIAYDEYEGDEFYFSPQESHAILHSSSKEMLYVYEFTNKGAVLKCSYSMSDNTFRGISRLHIYDDGTVTWYDIRENRLDVLKDGNLITVSQGTYNFKDGSAYSVYHNGELYFISNDGENQLMKCEIGKEAEVVSQNVFALWATPNGVFYVSDARYDSSGFALCGDLWREGDKKPLVEDEARAIMNKN